MATYIQIFELKISRTQNKIKNQQNETHCTAPHHHMCQCPRVKFSYNMENNKWQHIYPNFRAGTLAVKIFGLGGCLWSRTSMFQRAGMKKGGLPPTFQYLILMAWTACDLDLVMVTWLASKWQDLKVGMPVCQLFYEMKFETFKTSWHFETSEDIMMKFKIQSVNWWNLCLCHILE